MAEEYPVAPARMASLRDRNGSSDKDKDKKGRGWFGKNKCKSILFVCASVCDGCISVF